MKRNKLGMLTMLALGGLMVCGPATFAQDKPTTPPPPAGGDAPTPPRRGRNAGLQAILDKLDLTDDQKEKVKPILADYREKMTGLRDLAQEERRPKMKEINEAVDAKIKDVLTADQFAKYQDARKQGGRRNAGGTPPPPAPAPDAPKADSK
jgi:Spy/CpxP family protein refolding chaperone